jgi:hypothetical protein
MNGQSRNSQNGRQSCGYAKATHYSRTARRIRILGLKLGGRAPRPDREPYTRIGVADKADKPKKAKAKPKKDEKGVLAALPSTRPERIGTRRTGTPVATATRTEKVATATAKKPAKPAAKKPARKRAPAKAATSTATSRPTAARRKAAAPRTFEPTLAAETAAGAADERAAGVKPDPKPRAIREAAPKMGARPEREQPSPESGRPSGVELVTTAVQAAGELTQIGLTIGGRIVKRAVDRLPKP